MSVSLLNALMSRAPQVAQLPDKHLCIDLLCCFGLITAEGGAASERKEEEEAALRTGGKSFFSGRSFCLFVS